MYELKVLDPVTFDLLAYIDTYESVQMERKDFEVGSLEIHTPYAVSGSELITTGMVVFIDPKHPYIVTGIDVEEKKSGCPMIIRGKQLKGICDSRLTVPDTTADTLTYGYDRFPLPAEPMAAVETVIKHYLSRHAIEPEDANRVIPNLVLAADQARGELLRWSSRFEPLDQVFKEIGEYTGMGFDISLDLVNSQFVFEVIPGTDHSSTSSSPVIFSVAFGNVDSTKYAVDTKPAYSVAYAGGAGDGEARLIQSIHSGEAMPSGFQRREKWLDCGSIDDIDDLVYEAEYKMESCIPTEALTGDIQITGPFQYGIDWDLGDVVTVQSRKIGIEKDIRITEIKESYEKGKRDINVTFGKRKQRISDEIRKIEARR